jgi:hypothetical protein
MPQNDAGSRPRTRGALTEEAIMNTLLTAATAREHQADLLREATAYRRATQARRTRNTHRTVRNRPALWLRATLRLATG